MPDFAALDAIHQATPTNLDTLDANMVMRSDNQAVSYQGDEKLFVKFYSKQIKNEEKSEKEGRAIYEDTVFINIKIPGDKFNDVNRMAFANDIQRFPMHYERFRKNQEQVVGTPLSAVPFLNETQVEEYKAVFIRTVEQLAGMSDVNCQKMMGSVTHKQQAQAFLDNFKGADKLREEFEAARSKQDKEMEDLRKQIAALTKKG